MPPWDDEEPTVWPILLLIALGLVALVLLVEPPNRPAPNEVCGAHGGVESVQDIDANNGWVVCRDGFSGETHAIQ